MSCLYLRNVKGKPIYYLKTKVEGKFHYQSLGTGDRQEAKRKLDELLTVARMPELVSPQATPSASFTTRHEEANPSMPVKEFRSKYLAWAEVNKRKSSVALDTIWLDVFTKETQIETMGEVTVEHIETFKGRRVKKLSPVTLNGALKTLKAIWNKGMMMGWLSENPFQKIPKLKEPKKPPKYLTQEQIEKLLEAADQWVAMKHKNRANALNAKLAICLAIYAGMRKNEAVNARWEWIDWERKTIKILNSDTFTTKSGNFRTIPLHAKLVELLSPYRKSFGFILEECIRHKTEKAKYRVNFRESFLKICELAGIRTSYHQCRHTFATQLCIKNISLAKIQKWLGHADIKTTMVYTHVSEGYDADINVF